LKTIQENDGTSDEIEQLIQELQIFEEKLLVEIHKLLFSYYEYRLQCFCGMTEDIIKQQSLPSACKQELKYKIRKLQVSLN
jgi:hypothetical protein